MAGKKKYNRRRRGRRYRRKNYNMVSIGRAPVPRSSLVKFRYTDDAILNGGVATSAVHLWSANSLFDPNFTATTTGHQPMGFDQWSPFYDHYTVIGAKIIAQFMPPSGFQSENQIVGVYVDDNSVPDTSYHGIREQPESNWKLMSGNGTGAVTVTKKLSIKRFFNSKNVLDQKELSGIMGNFPSDPPPHGGSPSEQVYFGTYSQGASVADDPNPINVHVMIEYIAILHEPKELGQS